MSEPITTKTLGRHRMYLLVRMFCKGRVMIALTLVLGLLKAFELPQDGSTSLGVLPLLFFCARWGAGGGFIACFTFGVLQVFIQGAVNWGQQSTPLDYVLVFNVMGAAGLGRGKSHGIFWGSIPGEAAHFIVHYISGITTYKILVPTEIFDTVFGNSAPYSSIYNGSCVGIDPVLCLMIFGISYASLKTYMTGAGLKR